MQSIPRHFHTGFLIYKYFLNCVIAFMFIIVTVHTCNATYVAAYMTNDAIVIGVDSRESHVDGTHNDDKCKVSAANDYTGIALIGHADIPLGNIGMLDVFETEKRAVQQAGGNAEASSDLFMTS